MQIQGRINRKKVSLDEVKIPTKTVN